MCSVILKCVQVLVFGHKLTTTLMCLAKSLELPIRKSEKAVWEKNTHTSLQMIIKQIMLLILAVTHSGEKDCTHSSIEHLVSKTTIELLRVGL